MSWLEVPFTEVLRDATSGNVKIAQRDYLQSGLLPIVDQGSRFIGGYTNDWSAKHVSDGPVIVFGDHTKVVKFISFPFAMGADGVKVLEVRQGWDPRFVYHYLRSLTLPDVGYSRHFKFLKEQTIPAPPIDEQRRIASLLDIADDVEVKRRRTLKLLEILPLTLFHRRFSQCDQVSDLGSVADLVSGGTPRKSDHDLWNGTMPWFSAKDLKKTLLHDSINHVADDISARTNIRTLPPMTNAVVTRGMILSHTVPISILAPASTINQDLKAILPRADLTPEFLNSAVRHREKWLLDRVTVASHGTRKIDTEILKSTPIPTPSQREVLDYSESVRKIGSQTASAEASHAAVIELIESLRARVFPRHE